MGIITDATTRLRNVLGDLFPEEAPSAYPLFPIEPSTPSSEPAITIRKSGKVNPSPQNPESKPLGKITSYNYKNEELPDTNSLAMKGAWDNKLTNQGLAVSPDIEKAFREQGIKPKDKVELVLADGTKLVRNWEDRTMQDKQAIKTFGKPLRGRFDLHVPDYKGPHEKDASPVVAFRRVDTNLR